MKIKYEDAKVFFHCRNCSEQFLKSDLHKEMSPRDYSQYEVSLHEIDNKKVIAVWCKRCQKEVVNSETINNLNKNLTKS